MSSRVVGGHLGDLVEVGLVLPEVGQEEGWVTGSSDRGPSNLMEDGNRQQKSLGFTSHCGGEMLGNFCILAKKICKMDSSNVCLCSAMFSKKQLY